MIDLPPDEKKKLYGRLYYSANDLGRAREYARFLLKKGWHAAPYERRGSIYMQQSAYVTALVISYARPFTRSFGWPSLPTALAPFSEENQAMHDGLMTLRNQVYAHTDSEHFSVQPFRIGSESIAHIVGEPYLRLTKDECERIVSLVDFLLSRLRPALAKLGSELADVWRRFPETR